MAREGTRSQTGNSRPRIFQTIDTAPAITRRKPAADAGAGGLKSKLVGAKPKPAKEKKAEAGSGAGAAVEKIKSAVGLAPQEPKKVQKKSSGVRKAVQKVKAVVKTDEKDTKVLNSTPVTSSPEQSLDHST
ncbi:uncharacterized protein DNG_07495 [Cephalotrichum gorgonifer]|uniref:Uncharacterized protein n=1 Tax=Cephalotrichum gorgonifer TaxID=2041049 RepID=A0AAE8N4S1_9PEZI|nr:uncharacterized protein DNG_07495 [Cephalotrichum gorgonifer]